MRVWASERRPRFGLLTLCPIIKGRRWERHCGSRDLGLPFQTQRGHIKDGGARGVQRYSRTHGIMKNAMACVRTCITRTKTLRGKNKPTWSFICMGRGMHLRIWAQTQRIWACWGHKHKLWNSSSFVLSSTLNKLVSFHHSSCHTWVPYVTQWLCSSLNLQYIIVALYLHKMDGVGSCVRKQCASELPLHWSLIWLMETEVTTSKLIII